MNDEPRKMTVSDELRKVIAEAWARSRRYSGLVRIYFLARLAFGFTKAFVKGFVKAVVIGFIKGFKEGYQEGFDEGFRKGSAAREAWDRKKRGDQDRQGR